MISQDKRDQAKFQAQLVEWQTKHICGMFVSMAEDKKQATAIRRHVEKIHLPLDDEESDYIDNRSFEEVVEQGAKVNLDSLPSYEIMEAMFKQSLSGTPDPRDIEISEVESE